MDVETLFFEDPATLEHWLEEHAATSDGIWVRMAKKASGIPSLDWSGAVEVLLCFGWIDGQVKRIDEVWYRQRFTPRRSRSLWSKVNQQKVAELVAAGRMRPAGLAEVERAKADGRWEQAYDGMAAATVPDDLAESLAAAGLTEAFKSMGAQERYAVIFHVQTARTPPTRSRRIARQVAALADARRSAS